MNDSSCVVDVALNVMRFFRHESCGKCTPCREGTYIAVQLLEKIQRMEGTMKDLELLEEIAEVAGDASFCGLGQSIPVPLLSLINNFRDEFVDHIENKHCPAGICKPVPKKRKKTYVR